MKIRVIRGKKGEYIWALRDVSFQVQQGEVLGIPSLEPEILLVDEVLAAGGCHHEFPLRYAHANGKIVVRPCLCYNLEESGRLRLDWLSDDERR